MKVLIGVDDSPYSAAAAAAHQRDGVLKVAITP